MQITRNVNPSGRGRAEWFTGDVYTDVVASQVGDWRMRAALVRFTPGARTAWHTHPRGQTIWIMEGVGLCQREGGPIEVLRQGDRVFFEPDENHWHGAAPDRFMTHLAMHEADETGSVADWGRHVTDEEYSQPPVER
ncbi:MAG TPA: cupin domain-containing protein [Thermomicrobiales bacterium]|nr:cupin domain-containing protein [Thermomicrobiales bacterium]